RWTGAANRLQRGVRQGHGPGQSWRFDSRCCRFPGGSRRAASGKRDRAGRLRAALTERAPPDRQLSPRDRSVDPLHLRTGGELGRKQLEHGLLAFGQRLTGFGWLDVCAVLLARELRGGARLVGIGDVARPDLDRLVCDTKRGLAAGEEVLGPVALHTSPD